MNTVGCINQPLIGNFPFMVRTSVAQNHFRKKARKARQQRGWSQADLAKRLTDMGIDSMYATTVAKIEAGDREIKLDEAAAMADLFDMSLDELVARDSRKRREDGFTYYVAELRDNARRYASQVAGLGTAISGDISNVSVGQVPAVCTEAWDEIFERGERLSHDLDQVAYDLTEIADGSAELIALRRGDGDKH